MHAKLNPIKMALTANYQQQKSAKFPQIKYNITTCSYADVRWTHFCGESGISLEASRAVMAGDKLTCRPGDSEASTSSELKWEGFTS